MAQLEQAKIAMKEIKSISMSNMLKVPFLIFLPATRG